MTCSEELGEKLARLENLISRLTESHSLPQTSEEGNIFAEARSELTHRDERTLIPATSEHSDKEGRGDSLQDPGQNREPNYGHMVSPPGEALWAKLMQEVIYFTFCGLPFPFSFSFPLFHIWPFQPFADTIPYAPAS